MSKFYSVISIICFGFCMTAFAQRTNPYLSTFVKNRFKYLVQNPQQLLGDYVLARYLDQHSNNISGFPQGLSSRFYEVRVNKVPLVGKCLFDLVNTGTGWAIWHNAIGNCNAKQTTEEQIIKTRHLAVVKIAGPLKPSDCLYELLYGPVYEPGSSILTYQIAKGVTSLDEAKCSKQAIMAMDFISNSRRLNFSAK